nr:haloacid dehalogenase [Rhabdochromatium marinum]
MFQSRRKCPSESHLQPAAYLSNGQAHSFMSARQRSLWALFGETATLIPTTARNQAAFARVKLPFSSWCILDYGGIILDAEGVPEPDWMARATMRAEASLGPLRALLQQAETLIAREQLAVRVRIIEDFGLPLYLVAKYRDDQVADLDRLQHELIEPWVAAQAGAQRLHRNDNNLAVIPASLGKEFAVRYLIERLREEWGEIFTIGVGDSLIDAPFMAECDYAIIPGGTQLFDATLAPAVAALAS